MGIVNGVNVVVGIPSFGMVSTYFMQSHAAMAFPLVSSKIDRIVLNKPIAEARNEIVEFALSQGANYIFWLDDDVIAQPDSFLKLYRHNKDIINGVYWSKGNPPQPLLFRGHLQGPYWNWHVGDLIEIDAAGNGLTLVKTDVYRRMQKELGGPWYSTEYLSFAGGEGASPPNNTEDLYFYWKAKKLGYKVWADTSVQAWHYDKHSKAMFGLTPNAPQAYPKWAEVKAQGSKLIADLGSGPQTPYMREEGVTISFDIREEVRPDVICDLRHIPVPDQTFDIVHSSHTLEHFPWQGVDKVLKEWARILKVGGELRLVVPNLRWSAKHILDDVMTGEDFKVLYGDQDYPKNFHTVGFTPNTLKTLVESLGIFEDIQTHEGNIDGGPGTDNWNLMLKATKTSHPKTENIAPDYLDPAPHADNWWPIAQDQTYEVRELTEEEIANDLTQAPSQLVQEAEDIKKQIIKNAGGTPPPVLGMFDFNVFKAKEYQTTIAEVKEDGLESNN